MVVWAGILSKAHTHQLPQVFHVSYPIFVMAHNVSKEDFDYWLL